MLDQFTHGLVAADAATMLATMTEDVTLRVAVHDEPFRGRPAVCRILGAVLDGALHDIVVTETLDAAAAIVVVFTARVAQHSGVGDGLVLVRTDADGLITDLTVFLRPLASLQALAEEMGRRLGGPLPDGGA